MFSCQRGSFAPLLFTYVKICTVNVTKAFIGVIQVSYLD